MKYDRPVWQLMHLCADAMTEVFRYDDVRTWFTENYPEVGEATIRAHVVGLTEGGAKHPQFQRRSPIFRRVARGEYTSVPVQDRGEQPDDSTLHVERGVGAAEFFAALDRRSPAPPAAGDPEPEDAVPEDAGPEDAVPEDADHDDAEPELEVSAGAEEFWPFPTDEDADDPVAVATEARRKKREKAAKRDRKAAKGEATRLAALEVEREEMARIAAERAEADRLLAVAQQEAERLQVERREAERVTAVERKRVSKLRKAVRQEREAAEMLDRERIERKARRKAERRAREGAERHLHEAAERRRSEDEDRRLAALSVREELTRLEAEALGRIEAERAMRARSNSEQREADRDREVFEQAERDRREFERDARERDQLEREEQQLRMSLRPMLDDHPTAAEPPAPEPDADPDRRSDNAGPDTPAPSDSGYGGIVIVRAPRSAPGPDDHHEDDEVVVLPPVGDPRDDEAIIVDDGSDAIVLGSLGERLGVPAPAKDAYRDLAFQLARRDAERSGSRWFVLSAEHGLLQPQEWVSPEDRAISDIDPRHRAVWASWVAARLELLVGDLHGLRIHVDAPDQIAVPVLDALGAAGAETTTGTAIHLPTTAREVEQPVADEPVEGLLDDVITLDAGDVPDIEDDEKVSRESDERPDARILPFLRISSVADHFTDGRHAVPAPLAAALPHHPGLYAWTVDHAGSRMLNRALMLPVRAGVIYVGQVGASTGLSESSFSLNDHVTRVQLHGRARASTFRMNLATSLAQLLGLHTMEDPRLTQWMLDHLSVTVWPTDDVANLRELEQSIVEDLRPALNIEQDRAVEYRRRIAELRGRLA